jgi:ABC-type uncharacterized transport system permease subunit
MQLYPQCSVLSCFGGSHTVVQAVIQGIYVVLLRTSFHVKNLLQQLTACQEFSCFVRELKGNEENIAVRLSYTEQLKSKRRTHIINIHFIIVLIVVVVMKLLLSYLVYGEQHAQETGANVNRYFTKVLSK